MSTLRLEAFYRAGTISMAAACDNSLSLGRASVPHGDLGTLLAQSPSSEKGLSMGRILSFLLLGALSVFCRIDTASAQSEPAASAAIVAVKSPAPSDNGLGRTGWRNEFGAGVISNPSFVGGDEYDTRPIPYIDVRYVDEKGTRFFANAPQGIGGYFLRNRDSSSSRRFNAGVAIAPGFNVRDDSLNGLDEVGIATEARLLLEVGGRRWTAAAVLANDIGSGHGGTYLDLNLAWRGRIGEGSAFYAAGPFLRYADSTYKASFFGVSPAASVESGFTAYDTEAGFERFGLQGLVSMPIRESRWRVTAILRGGRLLDNAADSPIVADRTQLFFLASLTRSF